MAKKAKENKKVEEMPKEEVKKPTTKTPKKEMTIEDILKELSKDYFNRFPNVVTFYATENKSFFFKLNSAKREASKKGGKVYTFNR